MSNKTIQHAFSENTIELDEKTGLPLDYHSFFVAYRPLIQAAAKRLDIPWQDCEDAVQEVQIKFWLKHGLDMYDDSYKNNFSTLLRSWASLFLLQERDKVKKNFRVILQDPLEWHAEFDDSEEFESEVLTQEHILDWLSEAEKGLCNIGKEYLVPVLHLCISTAEESRKPTRQEIADVADVSLHKATPLIKELRTALTELGYGLTSLYKHEL